MRTLNIVSPHADDAALSMANSLAALQRLGVHINIVSCFTRTNWAPCLKSPDDIDYVTSVRLSEDRQFVSLLGNHSCLHQLGFDDNIIRSDRGALTVGEGTANFESSRETLTQALAQRLLAFNGPEVGWALPLSLGHADHLIARNAGLMAAQGKPLMFYEDVPYLLWMTDDQLSDVVRTIERIIGAPLNPTWLNQGVDSSFWDKAVSCYVSQFKIAQVKIMSKLMTSRGGERIWITDSLMPVLCNGTR